MRKELYNALIEVLSRIGTDGELLPEVPSEESERLIKHVDLWNRNVEFIEEEESWQRPAVFVEFGHIEWNPIQPGIEYRSEPELKLHIVTDWEGSSSACSPFKEESLKVFDLCDILHRHLRLLHGEGFTALDLKGSDTNHDHEDIVETIETYQYVAIRSL